MLVAICRLLDLLLWFAHHTHHVASGQVACLRQQTFATDSPDIHCVCVFSSIGLRIQAKSERCASFTISATICRQHEIGINADSEEVLLPHID